ncbi:MAG TPA: hypothetical protein VJ851_07970 [Jatrophihabitans sp.]|nr:hypothetical protein [Jatrophihabitans sp.]
MTDTELEDRLATMFERRAAGITTVPPIRFAPPDQIRTRTSPAPFAVAAAVAAVLVAVGGTVVGIRAVHHQSPPLGGDRSTTATPTSSAPSPSEIAVCRANMPQSWQRAITAGQIPLDHPINNVISVNAGTGDYLVEQVRPEQVTLAVFHGKTGQDVAQFNGTTEPLADGSAAVTADWIGYGLHQRGGNNGYRTAMLYNRHTGQSITLDDLTAADTAGQLNGGPILFDGKAYWLEEFPSQHRGLVKSYDLASGTRTSTPVTAATALVYYGTGLAVITQSDQGSGLVNYIGKALAPAALRAAADAGYFTFDGSTLRWWNYSSGSSSQTFLYANRPGSSQVNRLPLAGTNMTGVSSWPFIEETLPPPSPILDLRTSARLSVPTGLTVQAVLGDQVLIGTGATKLGNGGLSLVSLKDLPTVHC